MYNLLMVYREGTWTEDEFIVEHSRFLEYTVPALEEKFKKLDEQAVQALKSLPTLFAYEDRGEAQDTMELSARVGRITSIRQQQAGLCITWKVDETIPAIHPADLRRMYGRLDIASGRYWEHRRSHWAVKDVDLLEVLSEEGIASELPPIQAPVVFMSYSWDSDEHLRWVRKLTDDLRDRGIDARLDQTHLRLGQDISPFMEEIRQSDRVIVVCSPNYMAKANERTGGAGYEYRMIVSELLADSASTKFIPVLRDAAHRDLMPASLSGRMFLELGADVYDVNLARLVQELHGAHAMPKPLGPRPNF